MEYTNESVENLLRNYYSLENYPSTELYEAKADLDIALVKLHNYSTNLYNTLMSVMVNAQPINRVAKQEEVDRKQINRRLHDGLHFLTMIMNGQVL